MELPEDDWVYLTNKNVEGGPYGPHTRRAFDRHLSALGWELAKSPDEVAAEREAAMAAVQSDEPDLSKMKRSELDEMASSLGIDPEQFRNRDEIAKAIEAATKEA